MRARRVSLLLVIVIVSVAALNACTGSHARPPTVVISPSTASPRSVDPLRATDSSTGITYELPVSKTDRVGDGMITFENISTTPLHILRIQPVYANGSAKMLGTGIVTLSTSDVSDTGPGITRSFPPVGRRLQPLAGATIEPSNGGQNRYALIVGIQLATGGSASIVGFKLVLQLLAGTYTQSLLDGTLVLCTGQPLGSSKCP